MVKQLCGAKTQNGDKCRNFAMSNGLCRWHGGAETPEQAGRYAEALPNNLWETFRAALEDADLLRLRNDIALLDSLVNEVVKLLAERRRLVESERKGMRADSDVLTREQAVFLVGEVLGSIRRHVSDEAVLERIAADFDKLMGGQAPI